MPAARPTAAYVAYRGLGAAIERVPRFVSSGVAAVIGEVMARRHSSGHELARRNLARVLASRSPGEPVDPRLLERTARLAFHAYARYWVEGARLPSISRAELFRDMTIVSGYEHLKQAMAAGKGVVMALPHVGSWEWGGTYLAADGFPMTTVAERVEPPELYEWLLRQRQAMGLTIVPLDNAASGVLLRALREGRLVGLLCDRDLAGTGVEVCFFGEHTTLPAGPATLALRTGATLLAAVVYSGPGRHHTGVISPPIDTTRTGSLRADVGRVTQAIACVLEGYIGRAPEQWHMFQPTWPSDRSPET